MLHVEQFSYWIFLNAQKCYIGQYWNIQCIISSESFTLATTQKTDGRTVYTFTPKKVTREPEPHILLHTEHFIPNRRYD